MNKRMFSEEVEYARQLNSKLSFGIGVFQGLSNLFVNTIVLGVIFAGKKKTIKSNQLPYKKRLKLVDIFLRWPNVNK